MPLAATISSAHDVRTERFMHTSTFAGADRVTKFVDAGNLFECRVAQNKYAPRVALLDAVPQACSRAIEIVASGECDRSIHRRRIGPPCLVLELRDQLVG